MNLRRPSRALACSVAILLAGCTDEVVERASAIIDGREAELAEIASTVAVYRTTRDEIVHPDDFYCTGVLIAPTRVLTAAHCVFTQIADDEFVQEPATSFRVAVGFLGGRDFDRAQRAAVHAVLPHPGYDSLFVGDTCDESSAEERSLSCEVIYAAGVRDDDDIAVLELESPIDRVLPARTLPLEEERAALVEGTTLMVSGYGPTDQEPGSVLGTLHIAPVLVDGWSATEILTRAAVGASGGCNGDSGGPLYLPSPDGPILVGIVSRARFDFHSPDETHPPCGNGGIYTSVAAHKSWIDSPGGTGCSASSGRYPKGGWMGLLLIGLVCRSRSRRRMTQAARHHPR